jgi:ribosomal protein L17
MPSEAYVRLVGAIPQRPHMEQVVAKFQKNFLESETRRARREAAVAQVRQQLAQQDKIKTEVERAVPTIRQMAQVLAEAKHTDYQRQSPRATYDGFNRNNESTAVRLALDLEQHKRRCCR